MMLDLVSCPVSGMAVASDPVPILSFSREPGPGPGMTARDRAQSPAPSCGSSGSCKATSGSWASFKPASPWPSRVVVGT